MRRFDAGGGAAEARVLRRTRIRLVAWSAGSTLFVLLALGAVLYVATARFLAADAEAVLRARAATLVAAPATLVAAPATVTTGEAMVVDGLQPGEIPVPPDWTGPLEGKAVPPTEMVVSSGVDLLSVVSTTGGSAFTIGSDPAQAGLVMGGPVSGTIAIAVPDTSPVTVTPLDAQGFEMALAGTVVVNEAQVQGVPMRILSLPVRADGTPVVIQVASDRTTELRTLDGLAIVLAVAGALAVLVAAAFGWFYAGRALVPVRESLRATAGVRGRRQSRAAHPARGHQEQPRSPASAR